MNFDIAIKNIRKKYNLTQQDLAKELNVSRSAITNYESGLFIPTDDVKRLIVEKYNVSLYFMFDIKEPQGKNNISAKYQQLTKGQQLAIENLIDTLLNDD